MKPAKNGDKRPFSREIAAVLLSLTITLLIGTFGYMQIEGWDAMDALFMTVITLSTIGYGETHPLSPAGRLFTIFLIFGGLGFVAYAFSLITATVIDGHLSNALRRRRMIKEIARLKNHFIICGTGPTALHLAKELKKCNMPHVLIADRQEDTDSLMCEGHLVVEGDATDDDVLASAGILRAEGVFNALETDRDNAFAAVTAKALKTELRIVSTQYKPDARNKLLRSGADVTISAAQIGGLRMVSEMVRPASVLFMDGLMGKTKMDLNAEEITLPEGREFLVGELNAKGMAKLLAVREPENRYSINPASGNSVKGGDTVVIIGTDAQREAFRAYVGNTTATQEKTC